MSVAKLTSKGQLVIPKLIRQHLDLQQGDLIDFVISDDGEVVMRPATRDVRDLKGLLPRPKEVASLEDMERAIGEAAGEMP
ncbi:MAG: antitoxin PrlF [Candidatus Latescibacterota bacterium]|jgi:antitoxin PrlF|tara:strand:+ start:622 stop:864 length:243 start_codon:yes stop_codon:yes gene_type:complete